MKNNNDSKLMARILLTILFIFSQGQFWTVLSYIDKTDRVVGYNCCQVFFAHSYALFCVFLTYDNMKFEEYWKKHPSIKSIVERILKINGYALAMICKCFMLYDHSFSMYWAQVKANATKFNDLPLQARCFLPAIFISILPILICILVGETFSYIYSEIMTYLAAAIGLIFVLANVAPDVLKSEKDEKEE